MMFGLELQTNKAFSKTGLLEKIESYPICNIPPIGSLSSSGTSSPESTGSSMDLGLCRISKAEEGINTFFPLGVPGYNTFSQQKCLLWQILPSLEAGSTSLHCYLLERSTADF
jgi:hypothetical protein